MSTYDSCRLTVSEEHIFQYTNLLLSQQQDEDDENSSSLYELLEDAAEKHGVSQSAQAVPTGEASAAVAPFYRPEGLTLEDFKKAFDIEHSAGTLGEEVAGVPGYGDWQAARREFGKRNTFTHPSTGVETPFNKDTFPPLYATAVACMTSGRGFWPGGVTWRPDITPKKVLMTIPPSVVSELWKIPGFRDYIFVGVVEHSVKGQEKPKTQTVVASHNFKKNARLRELVEKRIRDIFIEKWKEAAQKKIDEVRNSLYSLQAKLLAANVRVTGDKIKVSDGIADTELQAKGLVNCHKAITLTFDYEFEVKPEAIVTQQPKQAPDEFKKNKVTTPITTEIIRR